MVVGIGNGHKNAHRGRQGVTEQCLYASCRKVETGRRVSGRKRQNGSIKRVQKESLYNRLVIDMDSREDAIMEERVLGLKCEEYGGTWTDIGTLEVGEAFYVHNGNWYGKITKAKDGKRVLEIYEFMFNKEVGDEEPKFKYFLDEIDTASNPLAITVFM